MVRAYLPLSYFPIESVQNSIICNQMGSKFCTDTVEWACVSGQWQVRAPPAKSATFLRVQAPSKLQEGEKGGWRQDGGRERNKQGREQDERAKRERTTESQTLWDAAAAAESQTLPEGRRREVEIRKSTQQLLARSCARGFKGTPKPVNQ